MALRRKSIRVALQPPDQPVVEHVVTITLGDQLRAELEAKRNGIELDLPMHMATVFAWAALTRLGLYDQPYQQFVNVDCLDWESAGEVEVDPTQTAAPTGSPSPSPSPTPEPAPSGGSEPTTS